MFSNPTTSLVSRDLSFPYRGAVLMTLLESSEMVLITTPPHPRSKLFAITFPLVPGGPDASMNGFSNWMRSLTLMARLGCMRNPQVGVQSYIQTGSEREMGTVIGD